MISYRKNTVYNYHIETKGLIDLSDQQFIREQQRPNQQIPTTNISTDHIGHHFNKSTSTIISATVHQPFYQQISATITSADRKNHFVHHFSNSASTIISTGTKESFRPSYQQERKNHFNHHISSFRQPSN